MEEGTRGYKSTQSFSFPHKQLLQEYLVIETGDDDTAYMG